MYHKSKCLIHSEKIIAGTSRWKPEKHSVWTPTKISGGIAAWTSGNNNATISEEIPVRIHASILNGFPRVISK